MMTAAEGPKLIEHALSSSSPSGVTTKVSKYAGEVVYIYAFDVAYEMTREPVRELLGHPVAQFSVDASKRSPRHLFFYRPQMVRLAPLEQIGRASCRERVEMPVVGGLLKRIDEGIRVAT